MLEPKHSQITAELLTSGRSILGSVRNPWSWYLSLWAYGCSHRGGIYKFAMDRNRNIWQSCYDDPNDPEAFQRWLKLMIDPNLNNDLGDERNLLTEVNVGIMTYRYFKYFCCTEKEHVERAKSLNSYQDFIDFESQQCFVDFFIKTENLEQQLIQAIKKSKEGMNNEIKQVIRSAGKSNVSKKLHGIDYYFDAESVDMIAHQERFLIERFNYKAPKLNKP